MTINAIPIPWTTVTNLDAQLTRPGGSAAGLKKARQGLRERLAPPRTLSLGRRGTLSLDNAALGPCLLTAARWGADTALKLSDAYRAAGVLDLSESRAYRAALEVAEEVIRDEALKAAPSEGLAPAFVPEILLDLVDRVETVREVALAMNEIHAKVAERLPEVRSYQGKLVRIEGAEALVVVDLGEREVLRSYGAGLLVAQGIEHEEDAFVLQELQWSPETTVSAFLPAFDPEHAEWIRRQRELAAYERPLAELLEYRSSPAAEQGTGAAAERPVEAVAQSASCAAAAEGAEEPADESGDVPAVAERPTVGSDG